MPKLEIDGCRRQLSVIEGLAAGHPAPHASRSHPYQETLPSVLSLPLPALVGHEARVRDASEPP